MHFLELTLQNFGPYHQPQTINLRTTPESPIILFGGMNGGGKTTLMDALRLALYGQRAKCSTRGNLSYSEFLRQSRYRHCHPQEPSRVELLIEEIIEGQPKQYRICRTWDDTLKNNRDILEIRDGAWQDEALTQTWDEYIEKLLPLGISNLFLFDGEQVKELAEQEEPTPDIVQAMRTLLGLELANTLHRDLEILIARKSKAISSQENRQTLEDLEQTVREAQNAQNTAAIEKSSLQTKLDRAQAELQQAKDLFYTEGGKIAAQQTQLHHNLNELHQTESTYQSELLKLATELLPLAQIQPLLTQALSQGKTEQEQEIQRLTSDRLLIQYQRFQNLLEKLQLTASQQQQAKAFLEAENPPTITFEPWLKADLEILHQLESILNHSLPVQHSHSQQLIKQLTQCQQKQEEIERLLATAASPEIYEKLVIKLNQDQQKVDDLTKALEKASLRYEQAKQVYQQATQDLQTYTESVIEQQQEAHFLKSAGQVQKTLLIFGDRLKRHKLNQLEIKITQSFLYLLHKSNLIHRLEINTETFGLQLYDTTGQLIPKNRLSAGEKQLLAIALFWGLARASGRQLPVAIDTPLGRLDSSHRYHLVERYFSQASHQVLLLSTDTEIGEKEVKHLRQDKSISHQYLIHHQSPQTIIESGYFW